jgi:hypothetical protein
VSGHTPERISDHAFKPSKRPDSCDFTYWQGVGPWLVCDYPESAHFAEDASEGHDVRRMTFDEWWDYTTYPEHCGTAMLAVADSYTDPIGEPNAPIWYCSRCGLKRPRTKRVAEEQA